MITDEVKEKFELWKKACNEYYNGTEPIMTDLEFDDLTDWLNQNGTPEIISFMKSNIMRDSGFEQVDASQLDTNIGMQVSLKKIKFKNSIETYREVIQFLKGNTTGRIFIGPKFDGCSININTVTKRVKTRGGQDVTEKLSFNSIINSYMKYSTPTGIICGEMVVDKRVFREKYSADYSNERNFVAGILNNKDYNPRVIQDLSFVAYTDGINPTSFTLLNPNDEISLMLPAPVVIGNSTSYIDSIRCWEPCNPTTADLLHFYGLGLEKYFRIIKEYFPYLCDGIVIGYETEKREIVNNYPTNMVAVKFKAETAQSKVVGIEWTQKKSERLNPICIIEPVELCGTTVTKASAFNYQYLIDNHIGIGAVVEMTKSGDIIPNIVRTIVPSSEIQYPDSDFVIEGKNLVSTANSDISFKARFYNAIKRLDIKGVGEVLSNELGELVNYDIFEVFNPDRKIEFMNHFGYDSGNWRVLTNIYKIKHLTLSDVVYMCQFKQVGTILAEKISKIITKQSNDISNIPEYVLSNVLRGEGFKKIKENVEKLKSFGIRIVKDFDNENMLTYEMTGEPPRMRKEDFEKLLHDLIPNARHTTLTKQTNFLITNDLSSNTSKMNKARKYNVQIITYKQAMDLSTWK